MTAEAAQLLRPLDPERYLASLYLPEPLRSHVMALQAFDAEVADIAWKVTEPAAGQIRLQWWQETINGERPGEAAANPLSECLLHTIGECALPLSAFNACLEARVFDLYNDPMPDVGTLEGYLGETASVWFRLAAECAGAEPSRQLADACGHGGVAFGLARLVAGICHQVRVQKVFVPLDILAQNKLDRETFLNAEPGEDHTMAICDCIELATVHLTAARKAIHTLDPGLQNLFRPLAFTNALLTELVRNNDEVFNRPVVLGPLKRNWVAFRGRI